MEQKCCRTLNTTILYDHPVQRSPTHHWYLPNDTDSRLAVSWIEAKQTEAAKREGENERWTSRKRRTETERKRETERERERERKKDRCRELQWGQESYRVRAKRTWGGNRGNEVWGGQGKRLGVQFARKEEAEKERRSARQRGWERESVREFTFVYLPDVAQYGAPTLDNVHRLDAVLSPLNRVLQDLFRIFHLSFQ